jgi:glycosyltransferase involved in cell wall biosynthesis
VNSIVSIITPVYDPVRDHLLAAYESVRSQQLPPGWELEWLVQEDGRSGIAEEILPPDPLISFGRGRRAGQAMTRNIALPRARGSLIKNLDHDDVLTEGVLLRDIGVLASGDSISWTTSRVLDLLDDGSTVGFEGDPDAGPIEPGFVLEQWRTHDYRLPVHPTTLCIRRELLVALGGWMAVPGSEDTGMLVAASVISRGYFHHDVGLLYRKWSGQASGTADHADSTERIARMALIEARAEQIRALWPSLVP